jgi:FkbM family methyltransferase
LRYHCLYRRLIEASGISIDISGKRKDLLIAMFDRLFEANTGEAVIEFNSFALGLNLANPSERLLYYAAGNILRSYRRSSLYMLLKRLAGSPGLFVDIGANLGIYSVLARKLGYETLLFEPEPTHAAFLTRNQAVVGRTIMCALSDHCGTADLFVSCSGNPGASSLVKPDREVSGSGCQQSICVTLRTFDAMLSELAVDPLAIRLIKIDVEGNEQYTVLGMREYLAKRSAAPIWCEVRGPESGRNGNSVAAVTEVLDPFGYKPYRACGRRLVPYKVGGDPAPQVFDLLYAIPGRHQASLEGVFDP